VVFRSGTAAPPTAPDAPTGVLATAGNGSATVGWTAPGNGGSPITSYPVTPFAGAVARPPVAVPPGATSTAVTGLVNGTAYTFVVSATNAIGTSPGSAPSNVVIPSAGAPGPTFVQQVSAQVGKGASAAAALPGAVVSGNRLIVLVGVWSGGSATAASVVDSAGDTFTRLTAFTASDHTQLSVWTAVVATGGTRPTVTATATGSADIGLAVTEYSGLSTVAGTGVVDQSATDTGSTGGQQVVKSLPTGQVGADGELALGFYVDSGFGTRLTGDPGYATRTNLSPNGNMDLLVEDTPAGSGATPAASVTTGASTVWLMATIVFRHA
jgi:hypothetical protein